MYNYALIVTCFLCVNIVRKYVLSIFICEKNLIKTICLQRQACLMSWTFAMVPKDNECTKSIYEIQREINQNLNTLWSEM